MKKISVPILLDTLFYTACILLLSFCLLRYLKQPPAAAVAFSLLISAAFACVFCLLSVKKYRKKLRSKREKERCQAVLLHLTLERCETVAALLGEAFSKDGKQALLQGGTLTVDGKRAIPAFTMQPLSADTVAGILRDVKEEKFLLVNQLSPQSQELADLFSLPVLTGEEIFRLLERTDCIPQTLICGTPRTKSAKRKLKLSFSRRNAHSFLTGGVLLLIMSLFVLYPVYYLVTGSLLLSIGLVVRFFGYRNPAEPRA